MQIEVNSTYIDMRGTRWEIVADFFRKDVRIFVGFSWPFVEEDTWPVVTILDLQGRTSNGTQFLREKVL